MDELAGLAGMQAGCAALSVNLLGLASCFCLKKTDLKRNKKKRFHHVTIVLVLANGKPTHLFWPYERRVARGIA